MSDEQRLLISFEARLTKYERDLERAKGKTRTNFRAMEKQAEDTAKRMDSVMGGALKSFGKGLIGGIVGGLAIGGLDQIISRVGSIAKGVASIGNEAKRAGLSSKAFQELGYVAEQNRIEVGALVDGMKELNLRADEFIVTGKGSAADAFQRLGFSAQDLKRKLADPSALLVEIIGRLEHLDKAAQIRIADEIFGGTGGERFVELIDRGADGLRASIKEANDLGLILSDDIIKQADEIDRKFNQIATTISTKVKSAVVETASATAGWLDRLNQIDEQTDKHIMQRLASIYQQIEDAKDKIGELQDMKVAFPGDVATDLDIDRQKQEIEDLTATALRLRDVLDRRHGFIAGTGEDAKDAKPPLDNLNNALSGTGSAASTAVKGIDSYADAIRALKDEIPELAEQLATLDARSRIESIYSAGLAKARTMGEVYQANALRDDALGALTSKGAREAADRGILDLIGYAEGTDKGRGYNETLAYGKFAGGPKNLVTMSLDEVDAMQTAMLQHPDNTYNSSASGRYQIVQKTLRGLRSSLGLKGDEFFDSGMQDRLAQELLRQRGNDPSGLRNEWEGLRKVDDATIRQAYDGTSVRMPAIDPSRTANIEQARQQVSAYAEIVAGAKQHQQEMANEQQALGMTAQAAAKLRYEQQMLAEAQRAGISLTADQRREIAQLAAGMASADVNVQQFAQTQEQAAQVAQFFGSQAVNALSGLLTGTMSAEQALQNLIATLIQAALQAALLGEGPLAGILGGGSGGGGGVGLGGIIGAIFGFADGGYTGDGGKHQPAGVVHRGEYVMSAAATRRLGAANLDAMHQSTLKGYASGGLVGSAPSLAQPALRSANDNAPTQAIQINAPITVEGSAGTPEQNNDLANKMAKQMEVTMRTVVADEFRRQARPGNFLNSRNR